MAVTKIGVIGAGTMGSGIAQTAAQSGFQVKVVEVAAGPLENGMKTIRRNLDRSVEKGRISEADRADTLARLSPSTNLEDVAGVDMVVEVIVEKYEAKATLFKKLDELVQPSAILASNTSSISITRLGACTKRPDKVIGMHFFNPVPVMKLVEVISGVATGVETKDEVLALAKSMGKTPVEVEDYPGFVCNRLLIPMINEAAYTLMEGVASRESIDTVMKLGANHPMGALELADLIGLDVCVDIMRVLQTGTGDDKYRPCPLLVKMVAGGWLGRKSGRGFYEY